MRKLTLLLFIISNCLIFNAQTSTVNFSSENLWKGDVTSFQINKFTNKIIFDSNNNIGNKYIYKKANNLFNSTWEYKITMNYKPNYKNYPYIILANTNKSNSAGDYYFISIGNKEGTICFQKHFNNMDSILINSKSNIVSNNIINSVSIKIINDIYGNWELYYKNNSLENYNLIGEIKDKSIENCFYNGLGVINTIKRNTNKTIFSNISIRKNAENNFFSSNNTYITISPNPVIDYLKINCSSFKGKIDYKIYDSNKRLFFKGFIEKNKAIIPTHYLEEGIYTIELKINDKTYSLDFEKQNE